MSEKRSASKDRKARGRASGMLLRRSPFFNVRALLAAAILVLFWTVGPNTFKAIDNDYSRLDSAKAVLGGLKDLPWVNTHSASTAHEDSDPAVALRTPADFILEHDEAQVFCSHYHLHSHREVPVEGGRERVRNAKSQRKIYDMLLITDTVSADMLELRLASMYPYVDYFVFLETPSKLPSSKSESEALNAPTTVQPSLLDKIWDNRLLTYHSKIIRRSLSQHSLDFRVGVDPAASTRNALYTRVIPLLTGAQKALPGDVLLVAEPEELVRPITLKVMRNCHIPERTTIRTRKYWYSYQWMNIVGGTTLNPEALEHKEASNSDGILKREEGDGQAKKKAYAGNSWWLHPQATVYQGADTILPDDLRRNRDEDQYVFGDGGWTCKLCYPTITETLAKAGEAGLVWAGGPRWKAAGRVVDRVSRGVELFHQTNLSRIDANPDIPEQLQGNAHRLRYMLNRDAAGANFADYDPADYQNFLAKKKDVDAEPDFETTTAGTDWNRFNTQDYDPFEPQPLAPSNWRNDPSSVDEGENEDEGSNSLSEEDRQFFEEIKQKGSTLSPEDIRILDELTGSRSGPIGQNSGDSHGSGFQANFRRR